MLDVARLRQDFPALQLGRDGKRPVYFDGAAGTQVPRQTIDAMVRYLSTCNANHGGVFATSVESDRVLRAAHEGAAAFLNAPSPDEIVFGANMTTLTFQLSRALARTWQPGDEVLATWLDHDANVTPWALAARDAGAVFRRIRVHPEDCTLDMDDFRRQLSDKSRIVAVTCASNLVGTMPDVTTITRLAHEAGALVFLDAVHYAPHAPVDVQKWGCDFLACSAYKFFGPHVGILWGRREHLESVQPYKLRPAPEDLPGRWMTGTQNHEGLAGLTGTLEYLAQLGRGPAAASGAGVTQRGQLRAAMEAIRAQEIALMPRFLRGLLAIPFLRVWGIADERRLGERVPTFAVTSDHRTPAEMARHLAGRHVFGWHGHMYAIGLTEQLGLEPSGGVLRLGLTHYNTAEEIDIALEALADLA